MCKGASMAKLQSRNAPPACSFCGKSRDRVAKLVAGPDAYICNECVTLCTDIMDAGSEPTSADPVEGSSRLVLASGSVSRLRVLRDAGFDPAVVVSGVSEAFEGLTPTLAVVAIAERKASAVAERCRDALVIGCDS